MLSSKRLIVGLAAAAALATFFRYADLPDVPIVRASSIGDALTFAALHANDTSAKCTGTGYTLTATLAAVACGTTSPNITLGAAGTWQLSFDSRIDNNGATYAASRTFAMILERTNNTPAQIGNGFAAQTGTVTTVTNTGAQGTDLFIYTTANSNDAISVFANVSVVPTAGSSVVVGTNVTAIRLF